METQCDEIVFHYWNLRARSLPVRLLIAQAPFKARVHEYALPRKMYDECATVRERIDGLAHLLSMPEEVDWFAEKRRLADQMPMANLPFLKTSEGALLTDTLAIARYLAKRQGIDGSATERQAALTDQMLGAYYEMWEELRYTVFPVVAKFDFNLTDDDNEGFSRKGEYEAIAKSYRDECLPKRLDEISSALGGNTWFIDESKATLIDFLMFDLLDIMKRFDRERFSHYPQLDEFLERFAAMESVVRFMKECPERIAPTFPPFCHWLAE